MSQLSSTDFFLDNLTGDLYSFHYDNNEWVTKANAGLHYEKTVQEYHTLGKYLLKVPTYRTKNLNDDKHVFITRKSESICYIKKNYINHWLVQNIDKEFLMENKSAWTIHTFNFLHKDKTFSVLADNDKGPTIICINNVAGVIFEIKQKYIPSQIILKNFVVFTIKSIKTMQNEHRKNIENFYNIKESPQIIFHKYNGEGYLKNRSIHFRVVSENYTNIQKKKIEENNEFRHVGFSANKSHIPSIYKKNIIRDNTLQNSTRDFNLNKKNNDDFFSTINVRPKYKSDIKKKVKFYLKQK